MALRCKVGDLCVVVNGHGFPQNEGRFCTVVERARNWNMAHDDWMVSPATTLWAMRQDGHVKETTHLTGIADSQIRPVRNQPGTDETLIWAGLPQPTSTTLPERAEV